MMVFFSCKFFPFPLAGPPMLFRSLARRFPVSFDERGAYTTFFVPSENCFFFAVGVADAFHTVREKIFVEASVVV